jgi:hypothetical protein
MENIEKNSNPDEEKNPTKIRIIAIGLKTSELLESVGIANSNSQIVIHFDDFEVWQSSSNNEQADLVVMQCPNVFPETVQAITEATMASGATRAVVIYHYTQEVARQLMEDSSSIITPLRAPISSEDLKSVCEADLAMATIRNSSLEFVELKEDDNSLQTSDPETIPPKKYSQEILSRVAKISTSIDCECPHHLSALLTALTVFEDYCKICESRNEEDVMLHSLLYRKTAQARSIMEDALTVLADVEDIELN